MAGVPGVRRGGAVRRGGRAVRRGRGSRACTGCSGGFPGGFRSGSERYLLAAQVLRIAVLRVSFCAIRRIKYFIFYCAIEICYYFC